MVEREAVEALYQEARESGGSIGHVDSSHLAALCRAWLAVDSGQVETVREAKFFDGYRVGKLIATVPEHMIGQRVRIVREGE
jgi:hypothetical protein